MLLVTVESTASRADLTGLVGGAAMSPFLLGSSRLGTFEAFEGTELFDATFAFAPVGLDDAFAEVVTKEEAEAGLIDAVAAWEVEVVEEDEDVGRDKLEEALTMPSAADSD